MIKNSLVSVIIITYNSAKFVLETLESVKDQTYSNIELIISDDCSTDDTIIVCESWLKEYKDRFVNTKIIRVKENTGIPKNCNRGLHVAEGEWIKLIAGDDALMPDCVKDNIDFVESNRDINFCFSDYDSYYDTFEKQNLIIKNDINIQRSKKFSELNSEYQFQVMVRNIIIHGPTTFYNKNIFISMGGYDEMYPFIEDWPTWYNWLKFGNKFHYLPTETIKYRVHSDSITKNVNKDKKENITKFTMNLGQFFYERLYQHYSNREKILFHVRYTYYRFYMHKNKNNLFFKAFRRLWYFLVQFSIKERENTLDKFHTKYRRLNSN